MASRALLLLGAPLNVSFLFFLWPKVHKINPKASALAKAAGDRALITGSSLVVWTCRAGLWHGPFGSVFYHHGRKEGLSASLRRMPSGAGGGLQEQTGPLCKEGRPSLLSSKPCSIADSKSRPPPLEAALEPAERFCCSRHCCTHLSPAVFLLCKVD